MKRKPHSSTSEASSTVIFDEHSVAFLLTEYERLRDLRTEVGQRAFRRFEFYLTIITAALGAYLFISQSEKGIVIPLYIIDLTLLGLFGYGIITYINLVYASVFNLDIIRAFKAIQRYFVNRDSEIEQYLYFNIPIDTSKNYGFLKVLSRGVGGGSEKAIIAFINGVLSIYLLNSLLQNYLALQLQNISFVVIAIATFIVSSFIHAIYVTFMYKNY